MATIEGTFIYVSEDTSSRIKGYFVGVDAPWKNVVSHKHTVRHSLGFLQSRFHLTKRGAVADAKRRHERFGYPIKHI